jgi:hypothetical protein
MPPSCNEGVSHRTSKVDPLNGPRLFLVGGIFVPLPFRNEEDVAPAHLIGGAVGHPVLSLTLETEESDMLFATAGTVPVMPFGSWKVTQIGGVESPGRRIAVSTDKILRRQNQKDFIGKTIGPPHAFMVESTQSFCPCFQRFSPWLEKRFRA